MLHGKAMLALSSLVLLGACAGPGGHPHGAHMRSGAQAHHPDMQALHEQMRQARSPQECEALMHRHMQAMHPGMTMQAGMDMPQPMRDMCMQHMRNLPQAPATQPDGGGATTPSR